MVDLLKQIYSQAEVQWLIYLMIANVITGIIASIRRGDFRLTQLADWLWTRVIPLLSGYGVAAFLASANPDVAWLKQAAFVAATGVMIGYVLNNLRDWGVTIPDQLAGKPNPNGGINT